MEENNSVFDDIMKDINFFGRFQKIFIAVFSIWIPFCLAMADVSILLILDTPDYWCYVPGREHTQYSLAEWKSKVLPKELDPRGELKYSSCKMFDLNLTTIDDINLSNSSKILSCVYGYEYDRTWYESTLVSKENWVCEKDLRVANTFAVSRIAEMTGTFVFGQLADRWGRKIIFLISFVFHVVGRIALIFTSPNYPVFLVFVAIGCGVFGSVQQSVGIIIMEISKANHRTRIAMISGIAFSLGSMMTPLLYWWLRDHVTVLLVLTFPIFLVVIFYKYLIESPRWLLSRRKFEEAVVQFRKIARVNGRSFPRSGEDLFGLYCDVQKDKTYGAMSLFSGLRLARYTIILSLLRSIHGVSTFTLMFGSLQLGGNPFINLFLQNAVDLPSLYVSSYVVDRIGRKWSNIIMFVIAAILCVPLILIAHISAYQWILVLLSTSMKFILGIPSFAIGLQVIEIYPTSLRQTGASLGSLCGAIVGIASPYFVYLGKTYDIRYPYYIIMVLFVIGGILGTFLPETLNCKLPDSLEEAKMFGANQKFFDMPEHQKKDIHRIKMEYK